LLKFYELSNLNPILFKKHSIGKIKDKTVVVGANEPSCVLIYRYGEKELAKKIQYISPKLNHLTENLQLIAYGSKDVVEVDQNDLLSEDLLWKIFVSGNWSEYQIIKKRILEKDNRISIECHSGGQPQSDILMKQFGKKDIRDIIKPIDFVRYRIKNKKLQQFNWAKILRRRPNDFVFNGKRLLIPVRQRR
jgi:hypothetical protein